MSNENELILKPRLQTVVVSDTDLKKDISELATNVNNSGLLKLKISLDTSGINNSTLKKQLEAVTGGGKNLKLDLTVNSDSAKSQVERFINDIKNKYKELDKLWNPAETKRSYSQSDLDRFKKNYGVSRYDVQDSVTSEKIHKDEIKFYHDKKQILTEIDQTVRGIKNVEDIDFVKAQVPRLDYIKESIESVNNMLDSFGESSKSNESLIKASEGQTRVVENLGKAADKTAESLAKMQKTSHGTSKPLTDNDEIKNRVKELISLEQELSGYSIGRTRTKGIEGSDDRHVTLDLYNKELGKAIKLTYEYNSAEDSVVKKSQEDITNTKQLIDLRERLEKANAKVIKQQADFLSQTGISAKSLDSSYLSGSKKLVDDDKIQIVQQARHDLDNAIASAKTNAVDGIISDKDIINIKEFLANYKLVIKEQKEAQYTANKLATSTFDDSKASVLAKMDTYISEQKRIGSISKENVIELNKLRSAIEKTGDTVSLKKATNEFDRFKEVVRQAQNEIRSFSNTQEVKDQNLLYFTDRSKPEFERRATERLLALPDVEKVKLDIQKAFVGGKEYVDSFTATITKANGEVQKLNFELANVGKRKDLVQVDAGKVTISGSNVVEEAKSVYKEIEKLALSPIKIQAQIDKIDPSSIEEINRLKELQTVDESKYAEALKNSNITSEESLRLAVAIDKERRKSESGQNKDFISNFEKQAKEVYSTKIVNDEQFDVAGTKLKALEVQLKEILALPLTGKQAEQVQVAFDKAKFSIDKYGEDVKNAGRTLDGLGLKLEKLKKDNSKALLDPVFSKEITDLEGKIASLTDNIEPGPVKELVAEFNKLSLSIKASDSSGQSFMESIERTFKRLGSYVISNVIMSGIKNQLANLYTNVIDIDFALKDLERVSGVTGQQLSQAFEKSGNMAIRLGSSIKDILGSVRDYSRLGLSMDDSLQMAEATALLASVGVMSLDKSTEGLISTTRAYNIAANDTLALVDKIVATDVSQAISSEGILDVLMRSSAALASANSSLEENIALGTAMNTVLQNSEKSGTALNAMVMRLRSTTGALQEMGEETDGTFESITKLQQRVYELTNQKVDIFINEDTFDSVYNTIQGISKEWSNMSDKAQAELTQILGGTRQAQAVSALITQFQAAEDAMESMGQSSGKALELNNVIMDTAAKKSEQLGASFEKLSQSAIDTTLVKGGLDVLRGIVDTITTINNSTGGLLSAGAAIGVMVAGFKEINQRFDFSKTFTGLLRLKPSFRFLGSLGTSDRVMSMVACAL